MARPAGTSSNMFDNDDDEEEEEEYRPETDMDELREAAADAEFAGGSKQQSDQDSSKEAGRAKIEYIRQQEELDRLVSGLQNEERRWVARSKHWLSELPSKRSSRGSTGHALAASQSNLAVPCALGKTGGLLPSSGMDGVYRELQRSLRPAGVRMNHRVLWRAGGYTAASGLEFSGVPPKGKLVRSLASNPPSAGAKRVRESSAQVHDVLATLYSRRDSRGVAAQDRKRRRISRVIREWDPVTGAPVLLHVERASVRAAGARGLAAGTCAGRASTKVSSKAAVRPSPSASSAAYLPPSPLPKALGSRAAGSSDVQPTPGGSLAGKVVSLKSFRYKLKAESMEALVRLGMARRVGADGAAGGGQPGRASAPGGKKSKKVRGFAYSKGRLGSATASLRAVAAAEGDIGAAEAYEKGPSTVATSGGDWAKFKEEQMGREERAALERQARHGEAAKKEFLDQARANEEDGVRAMKAASSAKRRRGQYLERNEVDDL